MNAANNTQYIIQRKLGEGGMGTVYLAEDTLLERQVAIKELNISASPVSEAVGNRFQQEALALARLNHPNITHLYAFLPKDDTYWMVMEYVNGNTLEEWLKIHGQMRPAIACSIIIQILDGLCHAHRKGIIHRDLKPANVMISEEGEVKVMDFGIARIRNSQRITQHGKSVGTLEYMAPEQIQGKEGDERTDIYAAGNILYELLCGQPPFRADTDYHLMKAKLEEAPPVLPALANVTPAPLKSIILKALERKPEKRFETASAFRDALNNCMQHSFLKESSLIAALTNPPSKELSLQNKSGERLSALKMNAATISSGFLNNLSYHSRQVSDQFVRLISGKSTAGNKEIQNDRSRGFLSRTLMRINDNAVAFLLIVVLLCGMLIIWNYFSGTARSNAEEFKTPALSAQEQDSIDKEQSNQKNAYLIETQLSKVPPLTVSEIEEGKSEDSKEETKSKTPPKETAKKKTDTSSNDKVSVVETNEENKPDNETPSETESTPAKREPTGPVTIPAGKPISLVLDENISSEEPERDGEVIRLHSAEDIVVQGRTIIRKGAVATGKIVDVVPSKGRKKAVIGFVINKVEGANGSMLKLDSERFKLIAQSAGSPAVYHIGQQFSAKLGRGKFE
jgi:serine/threonine-protein kinase